MIPQKIARLCKAEQCDLLLLSGDLFDGSYTRETMTALCTALESVRIPVVIAPGNHDPYRDNSPYCKEQWPGNVHIFTQPEITSFVLPELDCRIYGAGYHSMDCDPLMRDFQALGQERWQIGVLHADPLNATSPNCPVTKEQIRESGLHYLALGHIHKAGSIRAGETLCAWPGCPMGRSYDELGPKGVILVQLEESVSASFVSLDTPRFYDEQADATDDPESVLRDLLPAIETGDFYRITFTGYSSGLDLSALSAKFPHIPNLTLRDKTRPEIRLWDTIGEDSLEGVYFGLLKKAADSESEVLSRRAKLAARISRQILDGEEVQL